MKHWLPRRSRLEKSTEALKKATANEATMGNKISKPKQCNNCPHLSHHWTSECSCTQGTGAGKNFKQKDAKDVCWCCGQKGHYEHHCEAPKPLNKDREEYLSVNCGVKTQPNTLELYLKAFVILPMVDTV